MTQEDLSLEPVIKWVKPKLADSIMAKLLCRVHSFGNCTMYCHGSDRSTTDAYVGGFLQAHDILV